MVASKPKLNETPPTPRNAQRQSSTRSRSRSTRAENEGVGKVDWVEPSTDPQDPGAASGSSARQTHAGEAVAVVFEAELKSEAKNRNSASPIETGDCVRGKTRDGEEVTGFALSVGRTYLKLTNGKVLLMDSVSILAHLPANLEQYCELVGKSRTEKLNEVLAEYQFYNLSNWNTTGERGQRFWDYKGWEMLFYKGVEVNISKDGETWYRELKRQPELNGNGKIYDYCVGAIDHAESIIARLEEYEQQATAQPANDSDNNPPAINETEGESIIAVTLQPLDPIRAAWESVIDLRKRQGEEPILMIPIGEIHEMLGCPREFFVSLLLATENEPGIKFEFYKGKSQKIREKLPTDSKGRFIQAISFELQSQHLTDLTQLAADINRLHSDCEQALTIAQSAQASALEHAKEAGLLLLQAKRVCGHGGWEKWREANLQLPSSTATLYQRIADRWDELQESGIATVKGAADFLKKARLNPQPVAEMQPVVHEKSLTDSLEGLRDNFYERKAAAESRAADSSSIPQPLQQGDTLTTAEDEQQGKVLAIATDGKVAVEWGNGHTGLYTPKEIEEYGYRRAESPVNTLGELPNAVETAESVTPHVWGLAEVHYAVRKFAVMNDRQWDEQMCDEVATAVLDFLAEY